MQLKWGMGVIVLVLSLASLESHADRILVIGDSWASPVAPELQIVLHENGYTDITVDSTPFIGQSWQMSSADRLRDIGYWLEQRPDVTIVQMSIGGNDWLSSDWTPYQSGTAKETNLIAGIIGNIETVVDHIISLRPDIQILWSTYDFPRPVDNVSPLEMNTFLITFAEKISQFAMSKPNVSVVDLNGTLQLAFGFDGVKHTPFDPAVVIPPGDPSLPDPRYPSPFEPFLSNDAWHMIPDGYKALAQAQFEGYYAPLLAGQNFLINPGLNDAWTNPETPGQGFFITVFPDIAKIFLAWFTYDTERPSVNVPALLADPGHRWLTAFGSYVDNRAVLEIEVTQGGIFDASDPVPTQGPDGTITLEFNDCNAGMVSYDIHSAGRQGVIPIERIALDNVPLCESFEEQLRALQ